MAARPRTTAGPWRSRCAASSAPKVAATSSAKRTGATRVTPAAPRTSPFHQVRSQPHQGGVRQGDRPGLLVTVSGEQGEADGDAVADHERGVVLRAVPQVGDRVGDAGLVGGERLAAGEGEAGVRRPRRPRSGRGPRPGRRRRSGPSSRRRRSRPSRASSRGSSPVARGDGLGGLARAQRAGCTRATRARGPRRRCASSCGLLAAGGVERDRQVALEAVGRVVGRLPVPGQTDHPADCCALSWPSTTTTSESWRACRRIPWPSGSAA